MSIFVAGLVARCLFLVSCFLVPCYTPPARYDLILAPGSRFLVPRMETGVSYFSARTLRQVRADLEDILAHHCTYVVHCLTEADLLFYRKAMAEIFTATRQAGLEVWVDPWAVAALFGGESLSRFLVDHSEALQVLSDGRRAPAACPNHPETRAFLRSWVEAAAQFGGQVLFWDEPHFYHGPFHRDFSGAWACLCDHCRDRFRAAHGRTLPPEMDDEVRAFREASLIDLLAELAREGKRLGMRNALCLIPVDLEGAGLREEARRLAETMAKLAGPAAPRQLLDIGVRDWDAAASIPDLDIFGCDPYWLLFGAQPEPFVRAFTQRAVEVSKHHGRDTQVWVQAFSVPEGREEEIRVGLRTAASLGATHLAAWSYEATASMDIRCARPELVWRILGEAFGELRGTA